MIIYYGIEYHLFKNSKEYAIKVAEEVGYENTELVKKAHYIDPRSRDNIECGKKAVLTLEDGTKLHYELVCHYQLKENQNE